MVPRLNRFLRSSRIIESRYSNPLGNRSRASIPLALTLFTSQTQVHMSFAPSIRANPVMEFNVTPQPLQVRSFITVPAFSNKRPIDEAQQCKRLNVGTNPMAPQLSSYPSNFIRVQPAGERRSSCLTPTDFDGLRRLGFSPN